MINRPIAIKCFEALYFLSIFNGALANLLAPDDSLELLSPKLMSLIHLIDFAVMAFLILSVSRRGANNSKWGLVLTWLIQLIIYIFPLPESFNINLIGILSMAEISIQSLCIFYLFTPGYEKWARQIRLKRMSHDWRD
jgi:Na+-driven multidrug efflux pump